MIPAQPPRPPVPPTPLSLAKVLLVEGATPLHFFEALLRKLGIADQIESRNFSSLSNLRPTLLSLVATSEFQRLVTSVGVVRDAETDAGVASQSVNDALIAAGLTPARTPPIKTSVFILPDNANPGMIETLCMQAVASEPTLADACGCVQDFFACLGRHNIPVPADITFAKHHAQAFLATRPQVQLFPGLAAYRKYWPWDNAVFSALKQFLQAL